MLPGSDLHKIKEKNQQLMNVINLINFHLVSKSTTMAKRMKTIADDAEIDTNLTLKKVKTMELNRSMESLALTRKTNSEGGKPNILLEATLADDPEENKALDGPTLPDDEEIGDHPPKDIAFRLQMLYDERLGKTFHNNKEVTHIIEMPWEADGTSVYTFQRINFHYLPPNDLPRLSRDHAVITAVRKVEKKSQEDIALAPTLLDNDNDNKLYGPTMPDTDDEPNPSHEEEKSNQVKNEYVLKDLSLNGTYYLKNQNIISFNTNGMKISGDFLQLKKGEEIKLEHGDIIALITVKPHHKDLIFGFQFLEY